MASPPDPPTPPRPLLSGIVVQWGDPGDLRALLRAWPRDPRWELVIVDNDGRAREAFVGVAAQGAEPPEAVLVEPGGNLGFAGGANAGVARARAPLVLIANPDAVPLGGALRDLVDHLAAHPSSAGAVPRLEGPTGEPQSDWQLGRLPRALELVVESLLVALPRGPAEEPEAGTPIEQPAAAALVLRRSVFEAIGGFDPGFFPAWFEDVDLAHRLRRAGHDLVYVPTARFRHRLGSSVGRLGYGAFLWIYHRNRLRYLGKHHGRRTRALARWLLVPGALLRLLLAPLYPPRRAGSRRAAIRGLALLALAAATDFRRPSRWARRFAAPPDERVADERVASGTAGAAGERSIASPGVAVLIVTWNAAADLPDCLEALRRSEELATEVVVVDCASDDRSAETARDHGAGLPLTVVELDANRGFAGGMNVGLAHSRSPLVLTLNADARVEPSFLGRLRSRMESHPEIGVGAVTGRLIRPGDAARTRRLDACGMRLTRAWRHLDRGSSSPDRGQWSRPERVFGGTGAACLFRRAALEDVALDGEIFDERFHSFREDAELCFRLRERGWEVLYEPRAVAEHRRSNLPERRRRMSAAVNRHALKNRYLLRLYHQTPGNLLRTLPWTLARDLGALAWVLAFERTSLAAYRWLWVHRRELLARRRTIQSRRSVPARAIDRWFTRDGEPL